MDLLHTKIQVMQADVYANKHLCLAVYVLCGRKSPNIIYHVLCHRVGLRAKESLFLERQLKIIYFI